MQELIIEERVSNFAMRHQKCGAKVPKLPLNLQEGFDMHTLTFKLGYSKSVLLEVLTCSISIVS